MLITLFNDPEHPKLYFSWFSIFVIPALIYINTTVLQKTDFKTNS